MFAKLATSLLVAFVAISEGAAGGIPNSRIVASWSLNTSTHFYDLPQTLDAARSQGWTSIPDPDQAADVRVLGYKGDPTFIMLFRNGVSFGIQISLRAADVDNSGQPQKWGELDAITTKVYDGQVFYTATVHFSEDEVTGITEVAFQEKNRVLKIPTNANEIVPKTAYLKGKCIPTMGLHYYAWRPETSCDALYPWVLLVVDDKVIGVAFEALGHATTLGGDRIWWENFPPHALRTATDTAPTCAYDGELEYGFISLHVWFQINPKEIKC